MDFEKLKVAATSVLRGMRLFAHQMPLTNRDDDGNDEFDRMLDGLIWNSDDAFEDIADNEITHGVTGLTSQCCKSQSLGALLIPTRRATAQSGDPAPDVTKDTADEVLLILVCAKCMAPVGLYEVSRRGWTT